MNKTFVRAVFDLDCEWEGLPPLYRVYVNNELFAERNWKWTDSYLQEILQIQAVPGTYSVRIEPAEPSIAKFSTRNHRVEHGPGRWIDSNHIDITG